MLNPLSFISKIFKSSTQNEIDKILAKHNIPILSLRPGKRKKAEEYTTDA